MEKLRKIQGNQMEEEQNTKLAEKEKKSKIAKKTPTNFTKQKTHEEETEL